MALPCNYMMLTGHLHSLFKSYIIKGRIRCPKESELRDLIPSFQTGAKTHRRALQSKFRSWAKRMEVENDNLVLASSNKWIIPQEMCDTLIMSLHSKDHLDIEFLTFKIQQRYTWTNKNFGMDQQTIIRAISKYCHNEKCKRDVKVHQCRKSTRPYRKRNPLSALQLTYSKISKMPRKSKYQKVVFDRRLKKYFAEKNSPSKILPKTCELNENRFAPKLHWLRTGGTQMFQPIKPSTDKEGCNNNTVLLSEGSTDKSTIDITVDAEERSKHFVLSSVGLVKKYRQNYPVPGMSKPACSREGPIEPKEFDCSKYNYSSSYENPQNVREFRAIVISAGNNPTLYPDVLSNPKARFLSVLGLAPKRIFSKEALSNFEFELKKKQLMNKPQNLFADRKVLRDWNKMPKLSHLYSTGFRKSSLRHTKSVSVMQNKSIQTGGHCKSREHDQRNLDRTYFRFPLRMSERVRRQKRNECKRNLNAVYSDISQVTSSSSGEDHSRCYEKGSEIHTTRVPDTNYGTNAVLMKTMQHNFPPPDDLNTSKKLRIKEMDSTHSSSTTLKSPEVIGIDEESKSQGNGRVFKNVTNNPLKLSLKKEYQVREYPKLFSMSYKTDMLRNQEFNNSSSAVRGIGGIACCCPPFHSKYSNSQNRNNFDLINRNRYKEHLLAKHRHGRRDYPSPMGVYPPMRFQHRYNPLLPYPFFLNTRRHQHQEARGNMNTHGMQTLKPPAVNPKISEAYMNEPNGNYSEIASNSSVWKPFMPRPNSAPNFDKNTTSTRLNATCSDISNNEDSYNINLPTSVSPVDGRYVSQPDECASSQGEYAKKNWSNRYYNNLFFQSNMMRAHNQNDNRFTMNTLESGFAIPHFNVATGDARYENMKKTSMNTSQFNLFSRSGTMQGAHHQSDKSLIDVKSDISKRDVVMDGLNKNTNTSSLNLPLGNMFSRTNAMTSAPHVNSTSSNMSLSKTSSATLYPNVGMGVSKDSVKNTVLKSEVKGLFSRPNIIKNANNNHIVKPIASYHCKNNSNVIHPDVGLGKEALYRNVGKSAKNIGFNFTSRTSTMTHALNQNDNTLTRNSLNGNSIISHSGVRKDVSNENVNSSTISSLTNSIFSTLHTLKSALNKVENMSAIVSSDISSTHMWSEASVDASNENAPLQSSYSKLLFSRHNGTSDGHGIPSRVNRSETVSPGASYSDVHLNVPKKHVFLSNDLAARITTSGQDGIVNTPNDTSYTYPGDINALKKREFSTNSLAANSSTSGQNVSGNTPTTASYPDDMNALKKREFSSNSFDVTSPNTEQDGSSNTANSFSYTGDMDALKKRVFTSNFLAAKSPTSGYDISGNTPIPASYPGDMDALKKREFSSNFLTAKSPTSEKDGSDNTPNSDSYTGDMDALKKRVFSSNFLAAKSPASGYDISGNTSNPTSYRGDMNSLKKRVSSSISGQDVSDETPKELPNSSGFNSINSRVHIVKCSQNDDVKVFNSKPLNTGSVVQSPEVSANAPIPNDFTTVTLDQLKELSKNFKIIVVNKQSRKSSSSVPVYRRIIPNVIARHPSHPGKQSLAANNVSCTKILPKSTNVAHSSEICRAKAKKRETTNDSVNKNVVVGTKDSSKKNVDDKMQTLANWIDKMKSSVIPFRQTSQKSMTHISDDLGVGISLIQGIRNALLDVEKKEELSECITK